MQSPDLLFPVKRPKSSQLEVHLVMKLEPRKRREKKKKRFLPFSVAEFRRDYLCVKVRHRCEFHTLQERVIIEEDAI